MKNASQAVAATILAIALVVGLFFLGFWIKSYSTNRDAQILQQTYGRQNALVEQILDDIKDANTPAIPAGQRIAIVDQICDAAAKLTGSIALPQSAQTFIFTECPQ